MNEKIKAIFKNEKLSWEKFAKIQGGGDRSTVKVKVEGWANKLNKAFNRIGYEVDIKKIEHEK